MKWFTRCCIRFAVRPFVCLPLNQPDLGAHVAPSTLGTEVITIGRHLVKTKRLKFMLALFIAIAGFFFTSIFVLILIAAIELSGKGDPWLAYVAGLFIVGRIGHAFGMDGGALSKGRMIGTIISMLTLLGLGITAALLAAGVL